MSERAASEGQAEGNVGIPLRGPEMDDDRDNAGDRLLPRHVGYLHQITSQPTNRREDEEN